MNARIALFVALFVYGCSSDSSSAAPVDVAGVYSGPVTNGQSTCPGFWNTNAMNNAMASVVQTGSAVSIHVNGAAGLFLTAGFGTNAFDGTVNGRHIDALIQGSVQSTRGGCVYTMNGNLAADLDGNTLTGSIVYSPQTNNNADCTSMQVTGCRSQQTFSLSRPAQ
jgi:hypothetical protein